MKRNIVYAFMLTLAMVLSACGGNSIEDVKTGTTPPVTTPNPDTNTSGKITTALQGITIDKANGDINANVAVTSTYASAVVATLSSMDITLGGCPLVSGSVSANPTTVMLNTATPTKNVTLTGKMQDASCVPTSYQLSGTNTLLENGKTTLTTFTADTGTIASSDITFEDSTVLKLVLLDTQVDLNESNQTKNIRFNVSLGNVGVKDKNITIDTNPIGSGSFLATTATTDSAGDAIMVYTGPTPIIDKIFDVKFCLQEAPTVCTTSTIKLTTTIIIPPVEPIDDINYFITFVPKGGAYNLGLDVRNNAIVSLIDKDTQQTIPQDRIKSIIVTSRDTSILKIAPEGGGDLVSSITFDSNRNAVNVLMAGDKENAGLAPIEVVIEYFNLNGQLRTRGQLFSIAVLQGDPTAFSINDKGVSYNFDTKQFEHKFLIQATDASSNEIHNPSVINVSAMASFATDATGREIFYGEHAREDESIFLEMQKDGNNSQLEISGISPFVPYDRNTNRGIRLDRAFVAIGGDVSTYQENGKWNIGDIVSTNVLKLTNAYSGNGKTRLNMAIGYNFRDKICTDFEEESVIVVGSTDGTYQMNELGNAIVTLRYDPYMIGKKAMILINMTGLNPTTKEVRRSGEVKVQTLRFNEPLKGVSKSLAEGETKSFRFFGVITTGTNDNYALRNATFTCYDVTADNVDIISELKHDTSCFRDGGIRYGGQAFIDYTITTKDNTKPGTFTLDNCIPDPAP